MAVIAEKPVGTRLPQIPSSRRPGLLSVPALVGIAVLAPWFVRLFTKSGILPRPFDFIDFPLAVMALGSALASTVITRRPFSYQAKMIFIAFMTMACAMFLSWIYNPSSFLRLIAGWVLLLQPFLVLGALLLVPPTENQRRRLLKALFITAFFQFLFAAYQYPAFANPDAVRGTLLEAGAGAHVMPSGVLLIAIAALATWRRKVLAYGLFAMTVLLATVADAKSVLLLIPVGLTAYFLAPRGRRWSIRRGVTGAVLSTFAIIVIVAYPATSVAWRFIQEGAAGDVGKLATARQLIADFKSDPLSALFGFGPGESVSRLAHLTTPFLLKEGSPVEVLGLRPGSETNRYRFVGSKQGILTGPGTSSFLTSQSSLLGVVGDYGLLGLLAFLTLVSTIVLLLRRSTGPLAAAAFSGWILVFPLALTFDWLEQPPYMLMLALLTGLSLTSSETNNLWLGGHERSPPQNIERRHVTLAGVEQNFGERRFRGDEEKEPSSR